MGEKELDRILDAVMKAKEELIREEATEEERNELIASLRETEKKDNYSGNTTRIQRRIDSGSGS